MTESSMRLALENAAHEQSRLNPIRSTSDRLEGLTQSMLFL